MVIFKINSISQIKLHHLWKPVNMPIATPTFRWRSGLISPFFALADPGGARDA